MLIYKRWDFDLGAKTELARPPAALLDLKLQEAAQHYPDDYAIQLACTLETRSPLPVDERMRALIPRFPNHPALYAHILRYATSKEIGFRREEEYLLTGTSAAQSPSYPPPAPTPVQLAAFDRDAAIGERIDPDNAYFPFMRAIGLFAAHRDAEALAAIQRAAQKTRWDDYIAEEVKSRWKMRREVFGQRSAIQRVIVAASLLFPHYARLRAVTRVAVYKAIEAERAGHIEQGLAIRLAIMRYGSLMRAQSSSSIGALVGIALAAIAISRPGGGPPIQKPSNLSADQWTQQHLDRFRSYLRRIGHPQTADWAQAEIEAGWKVRDIIRKGMGLSPIGGAPYFRLLIFWIADMIVLGNALWLLVIGIAATLTARIRAQWADILILLALGLVALVALALGLSQWSEALATMWDVITDLTGEATRSALPPLFIKIVSILATVVLPLIVTFILLVSASVRRQPPSALFARKMPSAALVLLLIYSVLVVLTSQQEARENYGLTQTLHNEGRYFARLEGQPWPGR